MMHLTGISSNAQSAKHMTGLSGGSSKTSNVFTMNKQNGGEEEDNVVTRLQGQINSLKERIQSIAENENLDAKTKGELTQGVREQIGELTKQLTQRRLELRQEELEDEEEEQTQNKAPESSETSKATGRSKYDTFSKDDGLAGVSSAMLSAANSVKLAELQQGIANRKENQIGILEKQAKKDTRLVGRTVPAGLTEKTEGQNIENPDIESAADAGDDIALTKSKAEANITDVTGQPIGGAESEAVETLEGTLPQSDKLYTLSFEKIWEVSRGASVEAKEDEIARLKSDISAIAKSQAQNLGDANRAVGGIESAESEEESAEAALQRAENNVIKGIYNCSVNGKAGLTSVPETDSENTLDDYA